MKANELQINNFLQAPNVQFVIPVYQRNYDWTNTECKELLNDIISVETEDRGTHFIGNSQQCRPFAVIHICKPHKPKHRPKLAKEYACPTVQGQCKIDTKDR
jgi:hypothetical protein